ncbi:efflux RND transporter periplasmic adaptor subunit [uncultured Marinobacter sp.]|uniref:efflux RND transporter periplasmic adaptor subunit n=1 Tax=uncultured Marinobacter sp. TaxID=187379 RepID=UPI0030DDAC16
MAKQWGIAAFVILVAAGLAVFYQYFLNTSADQEARSRSPARVNVMAPETMPVRDRITAVGTLRARDAVELTAEVSGRVVELDFREGDRVNGGQLLVRLDDRQAQADLQVANARLADARRQYERAQRLRSNNSISQSQVDELRTGLDVGEAERQAARIRLDNHRIEAPFDGIVGLADISIGTYLTAGSAITTLDATEQMELSFSVPERFLGQIQVGQPVEGISAAYANESFQGELAQLGTRVSELSRTLPVRALISNPDGRLRSGQFMSVRLTLREREALVVPEQAILNQGDRKYLFVVDDGVARRLEIQTGSREPGKVEIVDGLSANDRVVVTGQDRLSTGDRVEVIENDDVIPDSQLASGSRA